MKEKKKTGRSSGGKKPAALKKDERALYCVIAAETADLIAKAAAERGTSRRRIIEAAVLSYCSGAAPEPAPPRSAAGKLAAIRRILGNEEKENEI